MIYRENSYENSSSFILDLKLNKNFNPNILIEYDDNESQSKTTNCLFYTGSVRHWGESNSMISISICSGLVSYQNYNFVEIILIILDWLNSSYSKWN